MSPGMLVSLDESQSKMLAVIEHWEGKNSCHIDNTGMYVFLLFFKLALDATVLCLCWRKLHTSFLSVSGLYMVLADMVLVCSLTAVWFLGPRQSLVSACFLLAHASAIYAALPLPTLSLGLLDYALKYKYVGSQSVFCKALTNITVALLVWVLAVVYSLKTVETDLMEIEYEGAKALVCEVQQSTVVNYFCMELFLVVLFALVPHCSKLPKWIQEANRLSNQRDDLHENLKSDIMLNYARFDETEEDEENVPVKTVCQRPTLFLSFTLAFSSIWMPYLLISVTCLLLGFGIPAYIVVNLLWLECSNSLLVGVVFWLKSDSLGPYSHLPGDICSWQVYWHLSRGTAMYQLDLPTACLKPSEKNSNPLLHL